MKLRIATLLTLSLASSMAFAGGEFEFKDDNKDGNLDRNEYYLSMADAGVFAKWDTDNDGLLTKDEFNEIDNDHDFDAWDTDGNYYLDAAEVYDGYYTAYDKDEDGQWNAAEWEEADEDGFWDFF